MNRRELLQRSAAAGLMAAVPFSLATRRVLAAGVAGVSNDGASAQSALPPNPLKPPASGSIQVAFLISNSVVDMDFFGPWVIFGSVSIPDRDTFDTYTVAKTNVVVDTRLGLNIIPDYTFETAPKPNIIVIPAQYGVTDAMLQWIRKSSENTDLTMSVCDGVSVLARTGLLDGKNATEHHDEFEHFAANFPKVHLIRGVRFVEDGSNLATSAGLSSGIDLSLRVVERYFGREVAEKTAYFLEYQGKGWLDPSSNSIYK
jgi:transcriptional regulator GlxA family with amidase domain